MTIIAFSQKKCDLAVNGLNGRKSWLNFFNLKQTAVEKYAYELPHTESFDRTKKMMTDAQKNTLSYNQSFWVLTNLFIYQMTKCTI